MSFSDDAERFRQLSAASSELETLRGKLQQQMQEQHEADHDDEIFDYIKTVREQCKEARTAARRLVLALAEATKELGPGTQERWPYAERQSQRNDMVATVNDVEDKFEDLIDSVDELIARLRGNGSSTGSSHRGNGEPDPHAQPA